ncbi:hypothetical protein [Paenibacillus alvei]|uniref:Uncharacterized protein n=1 Tax=Paenibacillus alvei TaxID=44250 RepID=A0AAP6ZXD6_PAEAL|nr:hypothetical protein [Paenibacillus alvei]NOJ71411.1 hypothetical protein [Paenibacillus alvei]
MLDSLTRSKKIDPEIAQITNEYIGRDIAAILTILMGDYSDEERADGLECAVSAIVYKLENSEYIDKLPDELKTLIVSQIVKMLTLTQGAVHGE